MKTIVTGGAGFIGSHLVDLLLSEGHEVHIVDNLSSGSRDNIRPNAVFHEIDVRDQVALTELFSGADIVFHLAANARLQFSIEQPIETNDNNVGGTLSVLCAARDAGVKRVVYAASSSAYGDSDADILSETLLPNPKSPYAVQKYVGELYARSFNQCYGLQTVALRFFNVYGPRQSAKGAYAPVIPIFLESKKKGDALPVVGTGTQTRDFTHVSDVARALYLAATLPNVGNGEVINIGAGEEHSILELAEMIGGPIQHLPPRIEVMRTRADVSRAKELLNWEPKKNFAEAIEELKRLY